MMTAVEFETLNESEKKIALFEAKKVGEQLDDIYKIEIFQIDDFFIKSTTCRNLKTNRILKTFSLNQFPDFVINTFENSIAV